jgi:large subunit ribosomal protein L24
MAKRVAIKRGDQVYVIAGKDRGKSGRVMRVYPQTGRVLVEGVNQIKRAVKANPGKNVKGGIVEREAPMAISNVSLICPETNAPTRVGFTVLEDGSKVRVARKSGAVMD